MLKSSIGRVGDEEKHIHIANQPNFASPLLPVNGEFPWMNITVDVSQQSSEVAMVVNGLKIVHTSRTPRYYH
jgi:hypothetical protein